MLWNVIYEFFVKYIFGGWLVIRGEAIDFDGALGAMWSYSGDYDSNGTAAQVGFIIHNINYVDGSSVGDDMIMSLGNYLSLIATIISMVAIVLICCALIKKIYNMCAHIIG